MIAREQVEAIRERLDIVSVVQQVVTLQKKGNSWMGLCPFHQEKSPSFSVVPHKGIFHCFGCGEGGDVFKFVMKHRGVGFFEAVKELGQQVGVAVDERELGEDERKRLRARADLVEVNSLAASFFHGALLTRADAAPARAYLAKRGLSEETIGRYKLGFAPEGWDALLTALHKEGVPPELVAHAGLAKRREGRSGFFDLFRGRLMIPIEDVRGRIVAFGGRILPEFEDPARPSPKYVNSPETELYKKSNVLYGLSQARSEVQRKGRALVVEGYFDVLSLHQAGFREAVATCGTALTPEHMRVLQTLTQTVFSLFDLDEAGERAAVRSLPLFLEAGIQPHRIVSPDGKDPDELIQSFGGAHFEELIRRSEPVLDLVIRRARERHGRGAGALDLLLAELAPILRLYRGAARAAVVNQVASRFMVPAAAVAERLGDAAPPADRRVAPPPRWTGTKDLNQLLWLLIHHPHAAAGAVVTLPDPGLLSPRHSVHRAVAMLLRGDPLPVVLDAVDDADLATILRAAASREGLFEAATAEAAAWQIVLRLREGDLDRRIAENAERMDAAVRAGDTEAKLAVLRERGALQAEKRALQEARRSPGPR
jgi:DNA primase